MTKDLPPPELLRKLLRYEPETGKLFWRERTPDMFTSEGSFKAWNSRWAGKEAFTAALKSGYLHGCVFGKFYRAHRVIWAMQTGACPVHHIDHVDGNPSNNRMENLREATHGENSYNRGRQNNNTSGYKGVSWSATNKKWRAQIVKNGKRRHLGYFLCQEKAHQAYCVASKELHGVYSNTGA